MKTVSIFLGVLALLLFTGPILRADDSAPAKPSREQIAAMVSSLKWQTGSVSVKDGLAKINLTPAYRFLGPEYARRVLHGLCYFV